METQLEIPGPSDHIFPIIFFHTRSFSLSAAQLYSWLTAVALSALQFACMEFQHLQRESGLANVSALIDLMDCFTSLEFYTWNCGSDCRTREILSHPISLSVLGFFLPQFIKELNLAGPFLRCIYLLCFIQLSKVNFPIVQIYEHLRDVHVLKVDLWVI